MVIWVDLFLLLLDGVVALTYTVLRGLLKSHKVKGLQRGSLILSALIAAYLLFGVLRLITPALATPSLQFLYSGWILAPFAVLLFFSLVLPALDPAKADLKVKDAEFHASTYFILYPLCFALLLGLMSGWSSHTHKRNLAEKLCDAAEAKISDDLQSRLNGLIERADQFTDGKISQHNPCATSDL